MKQQNSGKTNYTMWLFVERDGQNDESVTKKGSTFHVFRAFILVYVTMIVYFLRIRTFFFSILNKHFLKHSHLIHYLNVNFSYGFLIIFLAS